MSSGIILRAGASWIAAGWAAGNAAGYIHRFLGGPGGRAVLQRLEAVDLYPGSLADFTDAGAEEIRQFHRAAVQGYGAAEAEGASGWQQPEFFPGFPARFRKLVEMVAADPRARE
jgi:hypothetical protein